MNQQAGIFFIPVNAQPTSEQEMVEAALAYMESEVTKCDRGTPERIAADLCIQGLMERSAQYVKANQRKVAVAALTEQISDLQDTLNDLRKQLESM